jgi:hypothetical protein
MKKYFLLAFVFLVFGVGRMAAQSVDYTFDKNADFSKYKTYKWVSIKNAQQLDELTASQLMGTLEVQLAKKGLTKTESDDADLYIGYQIASANEKHLNNAIGLAYGSGVGGSSGAAEATTTTVHSGKLVLDMYDSGKRQLVWRGVVTHSIDPDAKPDKKQQHMDKAIEKLLKNYPPPKK